MKTSLSASRIIWSEIAAFGAIITIGWANEIAGLEGSLFGEIHAPNWRDSIVETVVTILVAIPTVLYTWRLTKRLHYLEEFLRVCAWCQKVGQGDDWISIDEFAKKTLNIHTTHGICPACSRKLKENKGR